MQEIRRWFIACQHMLLVILATAVGVGPGFARAADRAAKEGRNEDHVLKLALEVVSRPKTDLLQTTLKLTATNASAKEIVVDKELCVGFHLRFTTDLTEKAPSGISAFSADRDVDSKEVKKLAKPSREDVKKRFVRLKPKDSVSRTYDLSEALQKVIEGHTSDVDMTHHGFYYEATARYSVPPRAKKLFITAVYDGRVWMMAQGQFKDWFGSSIDDLGVWQGSAGSNTVVVEKK